MQNINFCISTFVSSHINLQKQQIMQIKEFLFEDERENCKNIFQATLPRYNMLK